MTKDQVTTLLNYWEKIIGNLTKGIERTIGEVAIQKHRGDELEAALKEAIIWIDENKVGTETLNKWRTLAKIKEPTMQDLSSPQEEVIQ